MSWEDRAACRDVPPDTFYPEMGDATLSVAAWERAAKAVCAGCPVRAECLDYALANDERFGVWGGLSERERRRLRRGQRVA